MHKSVNTKTNNADTKNTGATASSVSVVSSARLHMGFFDLHGGLGRKFGSIGLSLASPNVGLSAKPSQKLIVAAEDGVPQMIIERASAIAEQFMHKVKIDGGLHLSIQKHVAEHAGLGSGTQLALAIGTAISQLYGLGLNTAQISALTGRGGRSGIGIAAFDVGGLLIDGGRTFDAPESSVPPLLARYDFPEDWRILLITDASCPGVHGKEEVEAFKTLPVFPENLAAHLCRHVLMQAMPALVERDLNAFGRSIQVLQSHVGDYFAPAQGGRYASSKVASVLQHLDKAGVACFGQSSWGPTGFAVFENLEAAENCLRQLKLTFSKDGLDWLICSGNNQGANIVLS
jgi:beta-ribofuranosylaminobenzene 5'-phosphate synthase